MTGKPLVPLIEYEDANDAVRAVYDDIMATRKVEWINNFWKLLANDPALLKRSRTNRNGAPVERAPRFQFGSISLSERFPWRR